MVTQVILDDKSLRISTGRDGAYVFDLEGRPVFFEHKLRSYERGLSGVVVHKTWDHSRSGPRRLVRVLSRSERLRLLNEVFGVVDEALREESDPVVKTRLALIASRGVEWLVRDETVFNKLYLPVSILPPDHYLSVVLQAVEGCVYNKCSFCDFYRDREYRPKPPREFKQHVTDVKRWLGLGILMRRRVFLADANALKAPVEYVYSYFKTINEVLPGVTGVYSFLDYFSTRLSEDELSKLAGMGLKRVYIGLESGSPRVLRLLNKPPDSWAAVKTVLKCKRAGVSTGVIILVGAGGRGPWREHVERTVDTICRMDLGSNDLVYLSRLVLKPGLQYSLKITDHLTQEELNEQELEFRDKLRGLGLRAVAYNILESVY